MSAHQEDEYYLGRNRHSHHSQITSPVQWSCSECTYNNDAHKIKCDMCLTPKPKLKNGNNSSLNNGIKHQQQHQHQQHQQQKGITFKRSFHESSRMPNSPSLSSRNNNNNNNNNNRQKYDEFGKIPNGSILPEDINFNPTKPISKQSVFERWMIAQIERQSGQQPAICVKNNVILTNLRRVRAPTTFKTIQQHINTNTNAMAHANNLDAGDFTDDEEEDLSGMYQGISPRSQGSQNGNYSFTPTPSDTDDDINNLSSFSAINGKNKKSSTSQSSLFGRSRRSARHSQDAAADINNINNNKSPFHFTASSADSPIRHQSNGNGYYNNKTYSKYSHINNINHNNNNINNNMNESPHISRTLSTDDATSFAYHHKKLLNQRRRKKTNRKSQNVSQLWFKAQSQLKQGRNPPILAKYNITLTNIRQHNPRFKDYQRRKSHHEKAATYLQVTGDKLHTNQRHQIDHDDDDFSETENDLSISAPNTPNTSAPHTPITPISNQEQQNSNGYGAYNNGYDPNQYVE